MLIQFVNHAIRNKERTAVISNDLSYTYQELLDRSAAIASALLKDRSDLNERRIAFLVDPSFDYVSLQWGIWRAGGVAVPLCTKHPLSSIEYVLDDTDASLVIYHQDYEDLLAPLFGESLREYAEISTISHQQKELPLIAMDRRAMILYTSGTTGSPKGVVTTHGNIDFQINCLLNAWDWQQDDHILNVLPMHHVHGIINVTSCALWSGACCEFLPKFDAAKIFTLFKNQQINLFMAVPTIYYKLITYFDTLTDQEQEAISEVLKNFRLMVSGSAALPVSVLERWREISGHTLLERYGMTEIGMAISNPYKGERLAGHIGKALPGVEIRLKDTEQLVTEDNVPGEIQIKGPNVFLEYWNKPEETRKNFTDDGWFTSGDLAIRDKGYYRILGRNSVDIIKSGGYKISALEIEEILRTHPNIAECGVVGIPDEEWGEIIGAAIILKHENLDLEALKTWLSDKLPGYKTPRKYLTIDELPRNVMGKVTKKEITRIFQQQMSNQ